MTQDWGKKLHIAFEKEKSILESKDLETDFGCGSQACLEFYVTPYSPLLLCLPVF